MKEIERKFQVQDVKILLKRIESLGFKFGGKEKQEDIMFFHPCEDLFGYWLRIRKKNNKIIVTAKSIPEKRKFKRVRKEVEIEPNNSIEEVIEFFEAIGFRKMGNIKKDRWIFNGEQAKVVIDEVEELGMFVEVEAKSVSVLDEICDLLGLSTEIKYGYFDLMNKSAVELVEKIKANQKKIEEGKVFEFEIPAGVSIESEGTILRISEKGSYYIKFGKNVEVNIDGRKASIRCF